MGERRSCSLPASVACVPPATPQYGYSCSVRGQQYPQQRYPHGASNHPNTSTSATAAGAAAGAVAAAEPPPSRPATSSDRLRRHQRPDDRASLSTSRRVLQQLARTAPGTTTHARLGLRADESRSQPYTNGHWSNTEYGLIWISNDSSDGRPITTVAGCG